MPSYGQLFTFKSVAFQIVMTVITIVPKLITLNTKEPNHR